MRQDSIATGTPTPPSAMASRQPRKASISPWHVLSRSLLYALLIILAFLFMVPLIWVLSSSLKYPAQVFSTPIIWIPDPVQWRNYLEVFTLVSFARYAWNSLVVAGTATVGAVISSSLVAFSLSRLRWPGRNLVFMMVLGTMMLPAVVTLVPTFVLMKYLGWLDSYYPLIVPSWTGANAFYIFLMRQFMLGIPYELDEAARIDGAGSVRIFSQLILPLSKSVIAAVVIFAFLERYNDLLGPAMYLTTEKKYTLSIGLHALSGTYGNYWPYVMAASTLMTLPIVVIFVIFQRQFIKGIQMTGMTGR
jgi:multiple sugar transport system permease protein